MKSKYDLKYKLHYYEFFFWIWYFIFYYITHIEIEVTILLDLKNVHSLLSLITIQLRKYTWENLHEYDSILFTEKTTVFDNIVYSFNSGFYGLHSFLDNSYFLHNGSSRSEDWEDIELVAPVP